jgi:hypothetical protein
MREAHFLKISWMVCRITAPPFVDRVKAGQLGRLKSLRENWVLYQGTTLVVPQLLENIAGL